MAGDRVGVGPIGSQFISESHAESLKRIRDARLVAVASPTESHARDFAARPNISKWLTDYRGLLALPEVVFAAPGLPNDLHAQTAVDVAKAKKHVVSAKPLCIKLADADRMIEICLTAGVGLMYAEELSFAPKYVRAKGLVDEDAIGGPGVSGRRIRPVDPRSAAGYRGDGEPAHLRPRRQVDRRRRRADRRRVRRRGGRHCRVELD